MKVWNACTGTLTLLMTTITTNKLPDTINIRRYHSRMFMQIVAAHPLNSEFLGNFSRDTTGDSLSAQQWVLRKFCGVKRSDSSLLPNGRFAEDSYN